jgi:hypothetical protein
LPSTFKISTKNSTFMLSAIYQTKLHNLRYSLTCNNLQKNQISSKLKNLTQKKTTYCARSPTAPQSAIWYVMSSPRTELLHLHHAASKSVLLDTVPLDIHWHTQTPCTRNEPSRSLWTESRKCGHIHAWRSSVAERLWISGHRLRELIWRRIWKGVDWSSSRVK